MSAYEELPGHHLRSTLDLVASTPASKYLDSMETPETGPHATASRRYDPRDRRPHMPPHTTILALQTLTLPMTPTTRLASASTLMDLARWIRRMRHLLKEGTRHLKSSSLPSRMRLNSLRIKECSSSKSASCRIGSTRNEKTCVYYIEPSSKSARHAHMVEELETSIVASSRIGRSTPGFRLSQPERGRRHHAPS
jgi:hypothetical protein